MCEDSGYVWVNVTVERNRPYIEWVKVEPEIPEMLEDYRILVSVRNPSDTPMTLTLWCNETGLLEGYDDQLLSPPANKSQTMIIPPEDNVTFEFKYKHYWRWMKPVEVLGHAAFITGFVSSLPLEDAISGALNFADLVASVGTELGNMQEAVYTYYIDSSQTVGVPKTIEVTVKVKETKNWLGHASTGVGVANAIAGLAAIVFTPETGGLTLGGAALLLTSFNSNPISWGFFMGAADPDANYAEPVYLEYPVPPQELQNLPESPAKELALIEFRTIYDVDALRKTLAKYYGALMANDTEWAARQLIAAKYYLNIVKSDFEAMNRTAADVTNMLKSSGLNVTVENVSEAKRWLDENGLPDELINYARKLGYSDEDITNFTNMLIAVNDSLVINYDRTIPALFSHTNYFITQTAEKLSGDASEYITVNASIDIHPKTINLRSKGRWITAWIEVPGYDVSKINISTVYLNGIVPAVNDKHGFARHPKIKDRDGDGYPELMVKFNRQEVKKMLRKGDVTLFVIGEIDNRYFIGEDVVKVI